MANLAPDSSTNQTQSCAICGSANWRELYTARDRLGNSTTVFSIVECGECGVMHTQPDMSTDELMPYYPNDYWSENNEPTIQWIKKSQAEKTDFLERCTAGGGRILDVGCGSGWFLRALDPDKWERFGVETGEGAVRAATKHLGEGRVFEGTLAKAPFEAETFDAITFWSALEHTNDPSDNLVNARRLLRRDGSLILQVPNIESYQAKAFKGDWFALDVPRHRYHFSVRTIESLLDRNGFSIYQTTLFSKAHNTHALRQSLKARLMKGSGLALFYLSIPFLRPFDLLMTAFGSGATITLAARRDSEAPGR